MSAPRFVGCLASALVLLLIVHLAGPFLVLVLAMIAMAIYG